MTRTAKRGVSGHVQGLPPFSFAHRGQPEDIIRTASPKISKGAMLLNQESPTLQLKGIKLLGASHDVAALSHLVEGLGKAREKQVTLAILGTIADICHHNHAHPIGEEGTAAIEKLLRNADMDIGIAALRAFAASASDEGHRAKRMTEIASGEGVLAREATAMLLDAAG